MSIHAPKYEGPNGEKFDAAFGKIEAVVERFRDSVKDGFQLKDLGEWGDIVSDCYDLAKEIFGEGFSKDDLTDLLAFVYFAIDPDIFLLPEWVETPFERRVIVGMALPLAVDAAWKAVERHINSKA